MNVFNTVRNAVIHKSINACILAYTDILKSRKSKVGELLTEDQRRNQLVSMIRKNSKKYEFNYIITTENGEFKSGTYNTVGRIDIGIFYKPQEYKQEYLSFECKRFIKENSGENAIDKAYYKEGIKRYETGKYLCDTGVGGVIAFCEDGNFDMLKDKIISVLKQHSISNVEDIKQYNHNYIHSCLIKTKGNNEIKIISIMMDFAKR